MLASASSGSVAIVDIARDCLVVIGLYANTAYLTAQILKYFGAVVIVIKLGIDKVGQALQMMILKGKGHNIRCRVRVLSYCDKVR